jgi:7,8-dihydropterin-6-yl-methyl-4-(beta-D-ribofuranosyl)aminobenzene 5'-phosphate synthase
MTRRILQVVVLGVIGATGSVGAQPASRVTVLYDAFGAPSPLIRDWGFAALVEYGGRRVLFDTGNNAATFAANVKQLGVDLSRLDGVVISHRHGDHTSGLTHLLSVNPGVTIYAPAEGAFFKSQVPVTFLEHASGLPPNLQYFGGKTPDHLESGTPWERGNFQIVTKPIEIAPGMFVLTTQSQKPGTLEMNEVSLAIRTPRGLAVVVGCSHPGVEKILAEAAKIDPRLYTVIGGFHLVQTPQEEVDRVASTLHDTLKIDRVAPGHCTSERGLATFLKTFGDHFDAAGVGAVLALP